MCGARGNTQRASNGLDERPGGETASARSLIQPRHMPCREISERHGRAERKAGLIANAIFRVHRIVARGVETRNRHVAMIDDLRVAVGDEARRREGARMQLYAVERRDAQGPEARIDVALVGPGRLPLILLGERPGCRAAREIIVDALAGKSIETLDRLGQAGGADAQQAGKLVDAVGARHPRWNRAPTRGIDEGEPVGILLVENEIAWEVGIATLPDVILA